MQRLLIILISLSALYPACAQTFFNKNIGGSRDDEAVSVRQASDGYFITGNTKSEGNGGSDVVLIKTDNQGNVKWTKTFGGKRDDFGWGLRVLSNNDVVITGFTDSEGSGKDDVLIICTDANGNKKWQKTFGGPYDDRSWEVIETRDGNIVVVGEYAVADGKANIDGWLMKLDREGKQLWSKRYGYTQGTDKVDRLFSVVETPDNGFILSGFTNSTGAGDYDVLLIKTEANGTESWRKTFGGAYFEVGHTVRLLGKTGYMIVGYSRSFKPNHKGDAYIIQTDLAGNKTAEKYFGGELEERTLTFTENEKGGFALLGYVETTDSDWDAYLVEIDKDLNPGPSKKLGDAYLDTGGHNILSVGNDYVFCGYITGSNKNIYITRTSLK